MRDKVLRLLLGQGRGARRERGRVHLRVWIFRFSIVWLLIMDLLQGMELLLFVEWVSRQIAR